MFLSPVPTLRRKKGTEKLDPISCAHVEAEEGYRRNLSCLRLVTLNSVLKAMDGGRDASAAVDESITGESVHRHDGRVA